MPRKAYKKDQTKRKGPNNKGGGGADDVDERGFLSGTVGCSDFWRSIKKAVVTRSPDRQTCMQWGGTILKAWKNVAKVEQENRGAERREAIETEIVTDLFFCSVHTKHPFAQRFTWITDAFLAVEKQTKKMSAMFFRCTMPVIWRNLEAPNEDVRMAVTSLILKFFPLISDNEFIREEYIARQQEAMTAMLMDSCVPIRVMAAKKVPEHLSANWDLFPRELIKSLLKTLVDELSLDSVPEVRAAVYEGFEHLLPCPAALNATQRSLEILAKRGCNDKSERVRLAAFKMLNKLHGHRYIKLNDVITLPECLHRLDFEHSSQIQTQIVRLLFRPFCPRKVDGIDCLERFRRIFFMCKHSRQAALHFHRLVYSLELMSIPVSVQHIRSLVLGVKMLLRKISGTENFDDTADTTMGLNITGASNLLSKQLSGEPDEKLKIAKDVLDSAIVLWMSIRFDLFKAQHAKENQDTIKIMANILQTLDNFTTTPLMDSALVIASFLPKDKIGKLFGRIKGKLETEEAASNTYFPHYVEALASWDMNKLIEIIERGLKMLRNKVVALCDPAHNSTTPQRRRRLNDKQRPSASSDCSSLSASTYATSRDSPRAKRARVADEVVTWRQSLELIRMLLTSPQTSANLKDNFSIYLEGFFESLSIIRNKFGELLHSDGWETKFDTRVLIMAYETFNLVALITKKIEQPRRTSQGEEMDVNEVERTLVLQDRIFYNELKWFATILNERTPTFPVIEMFLRCSCMHMCSGQLGPLVLHEMGNMLIELRHRLQMVYDARSVLLALRKCLEHLEEALESCEDREQAQRTLERKVRPLQEWFEAEDRENTQPTVDDDNDVDDQQEQVVLESDQNDDGDEDAE